jgi:hypothetical protein
MRKAVPQGNSRHVGLLARTQKFITHKLQSNPPQERAGGDLAPLTKPGLQRAQADAEMIGNVRHRDWRAGALSIMKRSARRTMPGIGVGTVCASSLL